MSIVTVGIDLAKNIFAVHGVDENGKAVLIRPKAVSYTHLDVYKRQVYHIANCDVAGSANLHARQHLTLNIHCPVKGNIPRRHIDITDSQNWLNNYPVGADNRLPAECRTQKIRIVVVPVSYTHLDVYKRQEQYSAARGDLPARPPRR